MVHTEKRKNTAVAVVGGVTLALALLFIFVFLVVPDVIRFIMSFKDYKMAQGLMGSPWADLGNYTRALGDARFIISLGWTLAFSAISSITLFVLSLAAGYLLLAVGKARWLRHALCTLLLLPLVVPGEFWAQGYVALFGMGRSLPVGFAGIWCALRYVGLPALLVTAAISRGKRGASVPLLAGGTAALILFAALGRTDFGFMRALSVAGAQSLDVYDLRTLMMLFRFGVGAAAQTVRVLIQAALMAAVAFPVAIMLKHLFPKAGHPDPVRGRDRLLALIPAGGVALLIMVVLLIVSLARGVGSPELRMIPNTVIYTLLAFFTAFVNTVLCFLLARPAACGGKAGKTVMTAVLILLTAMSMAAVSIGEFMTYRSLGMYNTWFAIALYGVGWVWGVWPLVFAAKGMGVESSEDWFKRMWKPAIALFAIQAVIQANNSLPSLLYMNQVDKFHPLTVLQNLLFNFSNRGLDVALNTGFVAVMILAVPVALLLILRAVFSEEESLALFMPGK